MALGKKMSSYLFIICFLCLHLIEELSVLQKAPLVRSTVTKANYSLHKDIVNELHN